MGVTRRMRVFDDPSLQIWFVVAAIYFTMTATISYLVHRAEGRFGAGEVLQ